MSATAEAWAWSLEDDRLRVIDAFILVFLSRNAYYEDGGASCPSRTAIARACKCDERSVDKSLARLETLGYIVRGDQEIPRRPGDGTIVWDVNMGDCAPAPEDVSEHDATHGGES